MKLEDGMLLYHGSYTAIEKIDLKLCADGKDFGKGFYLTSDLQQARSFVMASVAKSKAQGIVPLEQNHGFITSFRFHPIVNDLKIHQFCDADREWLWFIAQNRRKKLISVLETHLSGIPDSDIIVGKVANDQTNPVITAYLNGLFGDVLSEDAVQDAIKRLMPDHLVDQYCFLTEKAISCLTFEEARKYVR